ncbi:MAG: hypothetical protein JXR84_22060 [Anaerolineae bacterium]|nr:hypothetical protein [Anaerolineae bacterium]
MVENPQILDAIKTVRSKIRWKPGSALRHLQKRKLRGHLATTATLVDYEAAILAVLYDKSARVYHYWYNQVAYVTVVGSVDNHEWLIMFAYDGLLESAFVIERPEQYLRKPGFEYLGLLGEVDHELR